MSKEPPAESGSSSPAAPQGAVSAAPTSPPAAAPSAGTPTTSKRRTLGPIPDLERHLPSDWWRHLFNSVYLKTDGDVVENVENTRREVDLLVQAAGLEPNDRILDLCCGQGRHSLALAGRGFKNVVGIDRSRYLVRLARRRARQAGLPVSFHEGDARKYRYRGDLFHCVTLLGNSFGYFDLEADDESVLKNVRRHLASNGTIVLDLTDGDWMRKNFLPRSWEWTDDSHLVCRERALSSDGDRLISREVVVHAERGVITDQFYAERLYSYERIAALLERQGFTGMRSHGVVEADSTRGHDLGMMAHRLFITAKAPRREPKPAAQPRVRRAVTVFLGDPRLPDEVKRGGQFNAEDHDTVQRLRDALAELDGYEFDYVDDHEEMITRLRRNPPTFVMNLCDEGYKNDAFKELHVPALLEMFGIPYTGAGPACLGFCYDKALVRAAAQSIDVPVPLESYMGPDDTSAMLPSTFPALVKPNRGDSSLGITKDAVVHNTSELVAYVTWLRETFGPHGILVQEFLTGPEYSVGILGNPGQTIQVLPPLVVDYSNLPKELPPILSYESKWHPDSPFWTRIQCKEAAQLDNDSTRRLVDYSSALFERLGCRDYARFDYRCDAAGVIKLLEVNPNPGWCWDGKLNFMAGYAGLRYSDMLRLILEAAQERTGLAIPEASGAKDGAREPAGVR